MLLEALNSIVGAFLLTEALLRDTRRLLDSKLHRSLLLATAACNVLLSDTTAWVVSGVSHTGADMSRAVAAGLWWMLAATATPVRW